MAGLSPTPEEISQLATPLLFGTLANWTLYGVLLVQTYVYSYNFPDERPLTKFLVYFIFVVETTQTALSGANVYYWFISGFGDFERLTNSHYAPIAIPIITGIISFIVQMYFCHRIWTLTRNVWLCTAIIVISTTSTTGELWGGSASLVGGKFAVSKAARISGYLSLSAAFADILIAIAMTLLLRRATEGFCRFVLIRVVRLTIETNGLTASVAVINFVLYVAFPNEIYCTFPASIIGKLYSNTLLVSLNNRIYFRDRSTRDSNAGRDPIRFAVVSRVCTTGISSNDFSGTETRLRSPVEVFKIESSCTRDLENGEGDSASINSKPSNAIGDDIHMKTEPSIAHSSAHGGE